VSWPRLLVATLLVAVGSACTTPEPSLPSPPRTPLTSERPGTPQPAVRPLAGRGALVYERLCAECHGASGAGDGPAAAVLARTGPPPTNFIDESYMEEQIPAWYFRAISDGVVGSGMPGWSHQLDEATRWDSAFYVWALSATRDELDHGRDVYNERCAGCHGPDGAAVAGARFDDAARVGASRAAVRTAVERAHPELVRDGGAWLPSVVEHLWTFLYEPAGGR
jgi:high-affinity iron transporter